MYNKFIISQSGQLRFGHVYLHREMLEIGEDGRSFDFGGPDFTRLRSIDWTGVGGRPLPLFFLPHWPSEDMLEPILIDN